MGQFVSSIVLKTSICDRGQFNSCRCTPEYVPDHASTDQNVFASCDHSIISTPYLIVIRQCTGPLTTCVCNPRCAFTLCADVSVLRSHLRHLKRPTHPTANQGILSRCPEPTLRDECVRRHRCPMAARPDTLSRYRFKLHASDDIILTPLRPDGMLSRISSDDASFLLPPHDLNQSFST